FGPRPGPDRVERHSGGDWIIDHGYGVHGHSLLLTIFFVKTDFSFRSFRERAIQLTLTQAITYIHVRGRSIESGSRTATPTDPEDRVDRGAAGHRDRHPGRR